MPFRLFVACDCDVELARVREELYEQVLESQAIRDHVEAEVAIRIAELSSHVASA